MTKRNNGFQKPYTQQFWVLLITLVFSAGLFFGLIYRCLYAVSYTLSITCVVIQSLLFSSMILCGSITAWIDPSDPVVVSKDNLVSKFQWGKDASRFCSLCQSNVHQSSLHCRYCDKCVLRIDHHCQWINNCVGKVNYSFYVFTIALSSAYYLIATIVGAYAFISFFTNYYDVFVTIAWSNSYTGYVVLEILFGIHLLISALATYFLLDLVRLHVYLFFRHMTTLEYSRYLRKRAETKESNTVTIKPPAITETKSDAQHVVELARPPTALDQTFEAVQRVLSAKGSSRVRPMLPAEEMKDRNGAILNIGP